MNYRLSLLLCVACQGAPGPTGPETPVPAKTKPAVQEITIGARGNLMVFDQGELKVQAGGKIRVTFVNPAEATMNHNIVFVQAGQTQLVAEQCTDEGSLKPDLKALKEVIAQTPTIGPGERAVVEFETPPPGRYEYVCTVRGHSQTMRGWLIVSP